MRRAIRAVCAVLGLMLMGLPARAETVARNSMHNANLPRSIKSPEDMMREHIARLAPHLSGIAQGA